MIRLAVRVAAADAQVALARLLDLAPAGLEEVELADGTIEYALYGPARDDRGVRAALGGAVLELSASNVADDWSERWRDFHRPVLVADRLWVRAPWEAPAAGGLIDIEIEPAQAFGTGAHPTTRLCLELLVALAAQGEPEHGGGLVDVGCGSGVLAIAAAKLGWSPVLAVDDDPASLAATRENAAVNGVAVGARGLDLTRDPIPAAPTVTANLLSGLLLELARNLGDGPRHLIASGLTPEQVDPVVEAFAASHGLCQRARRCDGGWAAAHLALPGAAGLEAWSSG